MPNERDHKETGIEIGAKLTGTNLPVIPKGVYVTVLEASKPMFKKIRLMVRRSVNTEKQRFDSFIFRMYFIFEYNDGWVISHSVHEFETKEAALASQENNILSDGNPFGDTFTLLGEIKDSHYAQIRAWEKQLSLVGNHGCLKVEFLSPFDYGTLRVTKMFTSGQLNGVYVTLTLLN